MSFLDGSLADVVEDLSKSGHHFSIVAQANIAKSADEKQFLLRKGKNETAVVYVQ